VSSAIINVAQDVDEPWPLEVIGHDGKAANVTMEPGDMVLYESHSVIHGRPFPLKGRFFANICESTEDRFRFVLLLFASVIVALVCSPFTVSVLSCDSHSLRANRPHAPAQRAPSRSVQD
jgi:hypothetical protein